MTDTRQRRRYKSETNRGIAQPGRVDSDDMTRYMKAIETVCRHEGAKDGPTEAVVKVAVDEMRYLLWKERNG